MLSRLALQGGIASPVFRVGPAEWCLGSSEASTICNHGGPAQPTGGARSTLRMGVVAPPFASFELAKHRGIYIYIHRYMHICMYCA